jgi:hypothetical protein
MARFRPSGSPAHAIAAGFYVRRPDRSAVDEIVTRLELEPNSAHLVVGGIGSGKTTQLLVADAELNKVDDVRAIYVDVSEAHDISRLKPGVLIVAAGLAAARLLEESEDASARKASRALQRFAHGYMDRIHVDSVEPEYPPDDEDRDEDEYVLDEQPPFLTAPKMDFDSAVVQASSLLADVCKPLRRERPHLIFLFDSLDRLTDMNAFETAVRQDVEALRGMEIGVVLAGPLRAMYGFHRTVVNEHFQDNFYPQTAVDVTSDDLGRRFLIDILRKRASAELLPDGSCRLLAAASGGVLRDMIALARSAGEDAYRAGAARVEEQHVATAARVFGQRFLFGLRKHEIEALRRLQTTGVFTGSSEDELALLTTQRVLAYVAADGGTRYAVHPTLLDVLGQLREAS